MAVAMRMGTLRRIPCSVKQAVTKCAVGVVAIRTLRVPVQRFIAPQRGTGFSEVGIFYVVRFGRRALVVVVYRHVARERKIAGNILDVTSRIRDGRGCAVTLVTGLFNRGIAA